MSGWILAAAAPTATNPSAGGDLMSLLPIILMVAVVWFVMFVPQRKQQKQRQAMLSSLKKGDKVITIGGMHGEIVEIDDEDVRLRVADKTEIKLTRGSISKIKS